MRLALWIFVISWSTMAMPAIAQEQRDDKKEKTTCQITAVLRASTETAKRWLVNINQLTIDMPEDTSRLKELEDDHTLSDVTTRLDKMNIPYTRNDCTLDTGLITPDILSRLLALPPGEPFVVTLEGKIVISAITKFEAPPPLND